MTTQAQMDSATSLCRNGCGRPVHYGGNPSRPYEGRGWLLKAWEPRTEGRPGGAGWRITWAEHQSYDYGTCIRRTDALT